MANIVFNALKEGLLDSSIDLLSDDIYTLLVQEYNATSAINVSATELSATVSFEYSGSSATALTETSGVNYTAGGYILSGSTVSAGDTSYWTASDIVISGSTITAGGMLIYKKLTPLATSIPLGYIDYGVDRVSENGNFTIQWNSSGIISVEEKS